jgi:hypothetical protein
MAPRSVDTTALRPIFVTPAETGVQKHAKTTWIRPSPERRTPHHLAYVNAYAHGPTPGHCARLKSRRRLDTGYSQATSRVQNKSGKRTEITQRPSNRTHNKNKRPGLENPGRRLGLEVWRLCGMHSMNCPGSSPKRTLRLLAFPRLASRSQKTALLFMHKNNNYWLLHYKGQPTYFQNATRGTQAAAPRPYATGSRRRPPPPGFAESVA